MTSRTNFPGPWQNPTSGFGAKRYSHDWGLAFAGASSLRKIGQREISMVFRLVSVAAAAVLLMPALTMQGSAADVDGSQSPRRFRMEYGGMYGRIGGHYYGVVPERYPFKNQSIYNYPGHLNNQTFWERVQTQRNYPVQY
jgi:hypothetical protein